MNNTWGEALITAIFLVFLMIPEGFSGFQNRPRDYRKSIPICDDRSIQTTQCILPSMEPLDWINAHNFCRSQSGFLPTAEEMPHVCQHPGILGTEIWSALINEQGVYLWITRYPAVAQNVSWEGGKAPRIWESKCSTYSRTSSRFASSDCQKKFTFLCIVDRKLEEELSENIELVVSSNFKSSQSQWIEVPEADFNKVILECSANVTDRSSQPPPVFWTKDDMFLDTNNITLSLANIYNAMNSNISLVENITKEVFIQGTYCCEAWTPNSSQTKKSNCVLVTLSKVTTLQVTAVITKKLWKSFKNSPRFTELAIDKLHGNRIEGNSDSFEFKFYAFVWDLNLENGIQTISEYQKNISELLSFVGSVKNISLGTYCLDQVTSLDYGNNVSFPFARGGDMYNSPYKCVTKENQQVFAKCQTNFTDGAFWDEQTCVRNEKCPKGFKTIGDQVCVKIIRNVNWEEGHTQLYQTGNEKTFFEVGEYLNSMEEIKSLRRHIIDYLKKENISELWLPAKRKYYLTPIVDYSFNQKMKPFFLDHWAPGHPFGNENCLAFNIKEETLFTDECRQKYNYAMLIYLEAYENDPITNENIVQPNLSLCEDSWHRVIVSARENICIKKFQSETFYLRKNAEMSCESQGAQLALPGKGFMDWIFRGLLKENETSWMILNKEANTTSANFDFINWLPETNFSKKYGIMSNEGWTMVDEDSAKIDIAICEKKVSIEQQHLKLSIKYYSGEQENTEVGNLLCVRAEPEHLLKSNSLKCFHNGADVSLNLEKLNDCQFSLYLEWQGHYECVAWSNFPIELIWSNVLKHVDSTSLTYIVIGQDNSEEYFPQDFDSTFYMNTRFEPFCLKSLKKLIGNESLSIAQSYFYKNTTGKQLNYIIHMECTKDYYSLPCRSVADLMETLRNLLESDTNSTGVCSVEYIRSSTGCTSEITSLYNELSNLTWPTTENAGIFLPQELCIDSEGQPGNRHCIGNYIAGFYWEAPPQACDGEISNNTKDLWQIYNDPIGYMNGIYQANVSELTKESDRTTVADFVFVASAMQKFAMTPNVAKKLFFQDVVSTMNNMMGARNSIMNSANEQFNSSSILLDAFETLAFLTYSINEGSTKASRNKLLVEIVNISKLPSTIGYEISDSTKLISSGGQIDRKQLESAIILPRTLSQLVKNGTLMFAVYETDSLFYDQASNASGDVVSSQIIQVSFQKNLVPNLNGENITLIFRPKDDREIFTCVFWDFSRNTGKGGWSNDGCTFIGIKDKLVTCKCDHLSHYAILFQSQDVGIIDRRHISILIWISNIGCSLSIFGLVMVLTTFVLFKTFRHSIDNKILANLSLAILMSMLIFLTGINQTWNVTLCRSVAVSLHYFILASFCWMLIVAIHQYFKFVKVYGYYIPKFVWKSVIFAWGVPVIPIAVILITDIGLYDYDNKDEKFCWMSYTALKFSFVPPVAITLFFNAIAYALIINGAILSRNAVQSNQNQRRVLISQISMAICVFILLGFTWIFGILSFLIENIAFPYLFCIFNTMQGFFIFIFHLYRNQNARKLWSNFTNGIRIRRRVVETNVPSQSAPGDGSQLEGQSSLQTETNI